MMVKFRNLAGSPLRNGSGAQRQAIENMARVTGLEPATSGVTGRLKSYRNQRSFRKPPTRNDAYAVAATANDSERQRRSFKASLHGGAALGRK